MLVKVPKRTGGKIKLSFTELKNLRWKCTKMYLYLFVCSHYISHKMAPISLNVCLSPRGCRTIQMLILFYNNQATLQCGHIFNNMFEARLCGQIEDRVSSGLNLATSEFVNVKELFLCDSYAYMIPIGLYNNNICLGIAHPKCTMARSLRMQ